MKILRGTLAVLFSLTLLITLFFTALQLAIFDLDYMEAECRKLSTAERLGMEDEDLSSLFIETLRYLEDERPDLVIQTVVNGESREAFNEQEKLHMVDVKGLFMAGFRIRNVCAAASAALLILYFLLYRGRDAVRLLMKALVITWGICILLIGATVLLLATHFDEGFILFHQIFFRNDLWLMDPATSLMINMVPEEFFFDMAMRIGLFVLIPILIILIGATVCWGQLAARRKAKGAA